MSTEGISRQVQQRVPWFAEASNQCIAAVFPMLRKFLPRSDKHRAAGIIASQAINDFQDLLHELALGDGRPAVRSARSLVEHAVNFRDVTGNAESAKRYETYEAVAAQLLADAKIGATRLKGKARRDYQQRISRRAKALSRRFGAKVKGYGSTFAGRWHTDTVRARCTKLGLAHFYPFYKIASAISHGTFGGTVGIYEKVGEHMVHRTGPSLELCPLAYHEGLTAFRNTVADLAVFAVDIDTTALLGILDEMLARWPDYQDALGKIDHELWPDSPPMPPAAVLLIYRDRSERWAWWDRDVDLAIYADGPANLPAEIEVSLRQPRSMMANPDSVLDPDERCLSIVVEGVEVNPRVGEGFFPAGGVLRKTK